MRNSVSLMAFGFVFGVQLFAGQAIATEIVCRAFPEAERRAYIQDTSKPSSWRSILQSAAAPFAVPAGHGTPSILKGVSLPDAKWTRSGSLLSGRREASLVAESAWGLIWISTQSGEASRLYVNIHRASKDRIFGPNQKAAIQRVFPTLVIRDDTSNPSVAVRETELILDRHKMREGDDFEMSARSLVNTLFHDPKGILNLHPEPLPAKVTIPRQFLKFPALSDNQEFLSRFGTWSDFKKGESNVEFRPTDSRLGIAISVNTKTKMMAVSLQTTALRADTLAQLRRIIRAAEKAWGANTKGFIPSVAVYGVASIQIPHLQIEQEAIEFLKHLDSFRTESLFEKPLSDLSQEGQQEVKYWLTLGGLNQKDVYPTGITYDDLVARTLGPLNF